jgi:uncharacterized metal-binding protein
MIKNFKNKFLFFIQKYLGGKLLIAFFGFFPYLFFKLFSPLVKLIKALSQTHIQEKIVFTIHKFSFFLSFGLIITLVTFFFQNSQKLKLNVFSFFTIEIELFFFVLIIFFIGYAMGYFTNYFSLIISKIKNKFKERKIKKLEIKNK